MDYAWMKGGYEAGHAYDSRIHTNLSPIGELSLNITNPGKYDVYDVTGFVQDCGNSSTLAMELLQSYAKPLVFEPLPCQNSKWAD